MSTEQSKTLLSRCMVFAAAPMLLSATGLTNNLPERVLYTQNSERAAMGVPPLQWNATLAGSAQSWADHLAATGGFDHAPEAASDPQGENLWAGTKGYYSAEAMVTAWIREKRYFKPGLFPNNSVTGDVADVGHYTQLMWRDTRQVGCAIATGRREDVLVCRYSSAGNYVGDRPF